MDLLFNPQLMEGTQRVLEAMQQFRPLVQADDVAGCRELAQAVAPLWPSWNPTTSLGELVAGQAVESNSLRLLQYQLQLPEGAAEAAAARRLPCSSSQAPPAAGADAATAADPLLLRDPGALGRLLMLRASSPDQEPAALMVLAGGAVATWTLVFRAIVKRMPALLEALLGMLPAWPVAPLPADHVLRVPCGHWRRWPYNESPSLFLLGMHQEQGLDTWDPVSIRMAEALGAAGLHPPVYHNVRVAREVRLPRLMPRKLRMNLRLGHEQQAEAEAEFSPGLEDPCFGARDRCRYLWLAITQQSWSPANHHAWPPSFQAAVRTLLLAAQRQAPSSAAAGSSSEAAGAAAHSAATLGSLPSAVLLHIIGLAADPVAAWTGGNARASWDNA